jgi:hypothetical protein
MASPINKKASQKFSLIFSLASERVLEEGTVKIVNIDNQSAKVFFTFNKDNSEGEGWTKSNGYVDGELSAPLLPRR